MTRKNWVWALVAVLVVLPVAAQEGEEGAAALEESEGEAAPAAPPTCEAAEHRQFDFWVGEWDVYRWRDEWDLAKWREENPEAEPSVNRISALHQGCALREEYSTPQGYEGSSINFYDRSDERWHQTWIDSTGVALHLAGGLEDGKMVLADDPPAGETRSRITWTPQPDGSVRQTWEQSADGEEWRAVFDGRYVRRGGSE